ncbi:NUDIX domain-containing protein [Actinomadura geliboluensis]|uniref:NUDIX domain-containing protein n=1 Tax=Actinomadura TaxID=1988 RepID=UPI003B968A48
MRGICHDVAQAPRGEVRAERDLREHPRYAVIPTFDLVVELPEGGGVVLVRRPIAPYQNKWALPGLRMFKPESIDDVIARIAEDELGLDVDVNGKRFLGQYVGRSGERSRRPRGRCTATTWPGTSSMPMTPARSPPPR